MFSQVLRTTIRRDAVHFWDAVVRSRYTLSLYLCSIYLCVDYHAIVMYTLNQPTWVKNKWTVSSCCRALWR